MKIEVETVDCILQLFGHDALFHFMVDIIYYSLLMTNVIYVETWNLKIDVMIDHLMKKL